MKPPSTRDLSREMDAARIVRDQIVALCGDDPDFIRDAIEGETGLHEIIAALVAADGEDKALIEGLDTYAHGLSARKDRIKSRIETRRTMLAGALELAGSKSIETPAGTIAPAKVAPKAVITEEADIPSEFWKPSAPTLDKKALNEALKSGRQIPGCHLSNGATTVTIRRN